MSAAFLLFPALLELEEDDEDEEDEDEEELSGYAVVAFGPLTRASQKSRICSLDRRW